MVCDEVGAPPARGKCSVDELSLRCGQETACRVGWARLCSRLGCSHSSSSEIGASPRAACAITVFDSVLPFLSTSTQNFLAGTVIFRVS